MSDRVPPPAQRRALRELIAGDPGADPAAHVSSAADGAGAEGTPARSDPDERESDACLDAERIEDLASGADDPPADEHVEACSRCAALLEEYRANLQVLARVRLHDGRTKRATPHPARAADPRGAADASPPDASDAPDRIDGYDLGPEIHRGGQGIVHRAVQRSTGRVVAIKLIAVTARSGRRERMRFDREVELAARVQHPGVVTIFDRGLTARGRRFYAMELVDGLPLDRHVAETRPTTEGVVDLMIELCDAVHAAHRHGVIHRDLKPGNILVDRGGRPRILDFGLARAADRGRQGSEEQLTLDGEFMGTLAFAAPEQLAGNPERVDLRADVYALGVILHLLLVDEHPYDVDGALADAIERILHVDPPPPSSRRRGIDGDLDAIVATAMEKRPDDRYASVALLAEDLRLHRAGLPIAARRASTLHLVRKFARRHRLLVSAAALTLAALVAGIVGTSAGLLRAQRSAELARGALAAARAAELASARRAYAASIAAADAALRADSVALAEAALHAADPALRGWEWRRLAALLDASIAVDEAHEDWTWDLALDGRGELIATAGRDGRLFLRRLGDATTPLERRFTLSDRPASPADLRAVALGSDGRLVAVGDGEGFVHVIAMEDGRALASRRVHDRRIQSLAFAPSGVEGRPLLASAGWDGAVHLLAARTLETIATFEHPDAAWGVAFSPDGARLATMARDCILRIWNVAEGAIERSWALHPPDPEWRSVHWLRCVWSPCGTLVAAGQHDGPVRVLRVDDGSTKAVLLGHRSRARALAFSPDGRSLATGSDDATVRTWDLDRSEAIAVHLGQREEIFGLAWNPDGERLHAAGKDGELRTFAARHAGLVGRTLQLPGHSNQSIRALLFAEQGEVLFSGASDADPSLRAWDALDGAPLGRFEGHAGAVTGLAAIGPERLLSSGRDGRLRHLRWHRRADPEQPPPAPRPDDLGGTVASGPPPPATVEMTIEAERSFETPIVDLAVARPCGDGEGVAALALRGRGIELVDPRSLATRATIELPRRADAPARPRRAERVAFDDSGRVLAVGTADGALLRFRSAPDEGVARWRLELDRPCFDASVAALAFLPGSSALVAGSADGTWARIDDRGGSARFDGHAAAITALTLLDGGERVVTVGLDRTVRIFDRGTGTLLRAWGVESDWLFALAHDPHRDALAIGGRRITIEAGGDVRCVSVGHRAPRLASPPSAPAPRADPSSAEADQPH
ncbi:MAG TPA: protein kinase [Phycisphaerales bacterium]|nr:protein kinase [Phycisphaerales bacterium]HMP36554.1 protein kinase [Phycisphaerales bacterium]